ncbi:uncharacterized protein LOC142989130 [Genypterus blacodes]|uniref:uncharacterized protein LOC142989130 n=1 Tax=Genypterus blacodes TaxID=154954 RepID=UPI003F767E44
MKIPVVDFGVYSLKEDDVTDEQLDALGEEMKSAFIDVGFVYLKNTGISQEEVDRVMDISKKFFLQPEDLKEPFRRGDFTHSYNHGWASLENERLNPLRPSDLKESYNMVAVHSDMKWPSAGAAAGFQEIQTSFFLRCKDLSLRVLRVMALSLGLDPEVFLSAHSFIGHEVNCTTLRALYYPPVDWDKMKEGQLRCGEHSDYGSITMLFQGTNEGLQVHSRSGEYISAPCIPGAVLINIADLMQRWTSDQFVSAVHKVLMPPAGDTSPRQCVAFFVQPDDDALISCCDGSNKYPPVTSGAYLKMRLDSTTL